MIGFTRVISGLQASELSLNVTGNNIINVNTEGYKRQRVVQHEMVSNVGGSYSSGLGVSTDGVRQIYSDLKEDIYRNELAAYGEYNSKKQIYDDIQTIIGDPMKEMMSGTMETFWTSINSVTTDPSSLTYRIAFKESACSFINQINDLGSQLSVFQNQMNSAIEEKMNKINEYAYKIKELNEKIGYNLSMSFDSKVNAYKDERSYVIEQLSNLINLDVEECSDGFSKAIRIGGGYLVSSAKVYEMELAQNRDGSVYKIPKWKESRVPVDITSGEIKGLLDARGYDITANLAHSSNGSPKEKADIVISIDPNIDETEVVKTKLNNLKANMESMLDRLDLQQVEYKLYFNVMGTGTNVKCTDRGNFIDEIDDYIANIGTFGESSDIFTSISSMDDIGFRDDSNKYLMVFTDNAINNGTAVTNARLENGIMELNSMGMHTIVVADTEVDTDMETWRKLTDETEGNIYDVSEDNSVEGYSEVGLMLSRDINSHLDENMPTDIIPNVTSRINALVNAFAKEINAIFRQGLDNEGASGEDLFIKIKDGLPLQMGNIQVNPIFSDVNKIPLSLAGDAGDSRIGEMLTELRTTDIFDNSKQASTVDGYYSDFIMKLGFDAGEIETSLINQETIVLDADDKRKSISAVSLDEELANMIKYQYAYGASSKMLTVVDEMLKVIVENL